MTFNNTVDTAIDHSEHYVIKFQVTMLTIDSIGSCVITFSQQMLLYS